MAKRDEETWTVTITSRKLLGEGTGKYGKWHRYGYTAINAEGEPIELQMSSFNRLPIGREIEVKAQEQEFTDRKGEQRTSWNLKGENIDADTEVEQRLSDIEGRLALLEGRGEEL